MNDVICPKCGSSNTVPFSDSIYKTQGFECLNCHSDFAVDDGKKIDEYISNISRFTFLYTNKDLTHYKVDIIQEKDSCLLTAEYYNGKEKVKTDPSIDFSSMFNYFFQLLYKQMYILDWKENQIKSESFLTIDIEYQNNIFEPFHLRQSEYNIYSNVFKEIFSDIFNQLKNS